ncbi:MAG: FtsX-like permease family protein, partial [Jiangellaceae bacterium]
VTAGRGWRPALRIARRTVRRNLGRSLLVAVLVGVPVAGATLVDVLYRTFANPEREVYDVMGEADAVAEVTPRTSLPDFRPQPYLASGSNDVGDPDRDRDVTQVDLADLLPAGTELTPMPLQYQARLADGDGTVRIELTVAVLGGAQTAHEVRLDAGRWPESDDEVLLTRPLAERLELVNGAGVRAGARVAFHEGPTVEVTGVAVFPACLSCANVVAAPGSVAAGTAVDQEPLWLAMSDPRSLGYLVGLPAGADADQLWPALAEQGVALTPRDAFLHPERYEPAVGPGSVSLETLRVYALVALVVGLGLLEVVLLAGAAFAVGARRQVRDLGLVAVSGGTARQVRRTVLAQGLVMGAIGAVLGIVVGGLLAVLGKPLWQNLDDSLIDDWRFGPGEILVAAAVGLLSGLAAAVVPAFGAARMQPVDALAGRFRTGKIAARMPLVGVLLLAGGLLAAFVGNRTMAGDFAAYSRELEAAAGTGAFVQPPATAGPVAVQLLGATLAITGLVVMIPGVVTLLARVARRLPMSPRYAVRDAARHRHRTAPAAAAIMIVVAGSVGLAFLVAGTDRARELQYIAVLPPDVIGVTSQATLDDLDGTETTGLVGGAAAAVAALLPDASVLDVEVPLYDLAGSDTMPPDMPADAGSIWLNPPESFVAGCGECWYRSPGALAIATPELFELTTGRPMDDATRDALAAGDVVVFDHAVVDTDGTTLTYNPDGQEIRLPAHLAEPPDTHYGALPGGFVAAQTAADHGWQTVTSRALVSHATATADQIDGALDAAEANDAYGQRESQSDGTDIVFIALAAGSAFVTLVGVAISVALAAAEGRADLATLAAVGAPPRRRRAMAGAQALVVGGLGTTLGVALGVYMAVTSWPTTGSPDFIVPWQNVLITGIGVPVLAVVIAMVFTPSRLPLVRRLE